MALNDIDTIAMVMLENRSFDHMLGYLSLASTPGRRSVTGLSADPAWLDAHANLYGGRAYPSHRLGPEVQAIDDPKHDRQAIAVQISQPPKDASLGGLGGFVQSYAERSDSRPADPSAVMGYYDQAAVPVLHFLAQHFAVCDHWFAALPASTQPNRLMAMSGESKISDNAGATLPDQYLVYDWLNDHNVNWCAYQAGDFFPFFSLNRRLLPEILTSLTLSQLGGRGHFRRLTRFAADWTSARPPPSVIFIEPEYGDGPHCDPNDDHPPTGVAKGQLLLAEIYSILISNPQRWARTMLIITYDEHGGFYDHVPPLPIPQSGGDYAFQTSGLRVPALVVSPQVAAGSVFNRNLDHTSVLQLLAERFDPAHGYSVSVNARHRQLDRLSNMLQPFTGDPRAPAIPAADLAALRIAAAQAPAAQAAPDTANARALHQVMVKAAEQHPDLLAQPGWDQVRSYLQKAP